MSHLIIKLVKWGLWGIILMFVSSHGSASDPSAADVPEKGFYVLTTNAPETRELEGQIVYEKVLQQSSDGAQTLWKLHLSNTASESPHYMGLFIAASGAGGQLQGGTYEINGNIEGFLQQFDGVFGFASINALGEQPFFAKRGKLTISRMGDEFLRGNLQITLKNSRGNTLAIRGHFNAGKK